jgi:tetratricopeptide (TPR) repeat protein
MFLRKIAVDDKSSATAIRAQLASGASFFELARSNSVDRSSSINGGFLGDLAATEMDSSWARAALALLPGEISPLVPSNGRYVILQRLPRNFREEAEARFNKAMELRTEGKRQESASELLEALKIYPHLLRALTYLGITYGEAGNPQTGEAILRLATRLYPEDAGAHFNLGIAEEALGKTDDAIAEYKRALAIQSDLAQVYLNLGGALVSAGQLDRATRVYRKGIEVDPLGASLHWSLGVALQREGKADEANREMALAAKIDPKLISSQPGK